MNVASVDLCRELYALSGWGDTTFIQEYDEVIWQEWGEAAGNAVPLYDLGFMLRKLPIKIFGLHVYDLQLLPLRENFWLAQYTDSGSHGAYVQPGPETFSALFAHCDAETLEEAVCKLCIQLFKAGVLVKAEEAAS